MTGEDEMIEAYSAEAFKDRLRTAREIARMTQEEAAKRADMHPTAWAHMEQGTRTPNIHNLAKACRAVRCSADWLLGLSTERPKARVVIVDGETFIPQNVQIQPTCATGGSTGENKS